MKIKQGMTTWYFHVDNHLFAGFISDSIKLLLDYRYFFKLLRQIDVCRSVIVIWLEEILNLPSKYFYYILCTYLQL